MTDGILECDTGITGHCLPENNITVYTHFEIAVYVFPGCCGRSSRGHTTWCRNSIGSFLTTVETLLVLSLSIVTVGWQKL